MENKDDKDWVTDFQDLNTTAKQQFQETLKKQVVELGFKRRQLISRTHTPGQPWNISHNTSGTFNDRTE